MMEDLSTCSVYPYQTLRKNIRSGDILLCSGSSTFSTLIQQATNSIWSHVGFVLRVDAIGRIMVLESVESIGVRTIPLSNYVFDYNATGKGYPGKILIARHGDVRQENMVHLSKFATGLLGCPYNSEEIIHIAMRIGLSKFDLSEKTSDKINKHTFICSEYAHLCFESIGVQIPYDPLGFIAPADFARCKKIQPLGLIDPEKILEETAALPEMVNA